MQKVLQVPHFSQLDNKFNPYGSCNVTSMSMCLHYLGIRGDGSQPQLEDQIYQKFIKWGLSRHSPLDIKTVLETYPGIKDTLLFRGTEHDIRQAIDAGHPIILHGYFTKFGHILVVKGYDSNGFIVNDPYGKLNPKTMVYNTAASGESDYFTRRTLAKLASPESPWNPSHYLIHIVERN